MAAQPWTSAEAEPDAAPHPESRTKKRLIRRAPKDSSQRLRLIFQLSFLALNAWIGVQFYMWVRHFETGGLTRAMSRPAGVDGWLPIAGLLNLKSFIATGEIPRIHPAAMFVMMSVLLMALLLKKAFCSWLCPVGTISEYLWKLGRKVTGRTIVLPRWLDVPLRGLKYLLLLFFVWIIASMAVPDIATFMQSPYGVIADVKMLNFFRYMGTTALATIAFFIAMSVIVQNFWCRYLCPYGALLGIVALASPTRITRDGNACIDCSKCAKACPARLPVDTLAQVRSAECAMCMECVAVCPSAGALQVKVAKRKIVPAWAVAATIAAVFLGIITWARVTGNWQTNLPDDVYRMLVPVAQQTGH